MKDETQNIRKLAHRVAVADKKLRYAVSLGKHAQYIRSEYAEISDELTKIYLDLNTYQDQLETQTKGL